MVSLCIDIVHASTYHDADSLWRRESKGEKCAPRRPRRNAGSGNGPVSLERSIHQLS